jgi:hypothetical protein
LLLLGIKRVVTIGVSFYVLPRVGPTGIQARAGSLDIDFLGWTNREFSCLDAILDHKREGHQGERCPDNLVEATMKNIFVGNLAFNTSEEDVRQLFAAYGQMDRASITRPAVVS